MPIYLNTSSVAKMCRFIIARRNQWEGRSYYCSSPMPEPEPEPFTLLRSIRPLRFELILYYMFFEVVNSMSMVHDRKVIFQQP